MTRKECLDKAAGCVLKDRQNQYGGPENNFERIAEMWSAYLGNVRVHSWDVAAMMGMLKLARARFNPKYADNWVDLAGYAACGIECATAQEEFDKALDEVQKKSMEHMFKKAEGNHPEIPDSSPEFKRGDRVQARLGDGVWHDAVVTGKEIIFGKLHYTVKIADFNGYYGLKVVDIRPAPKAEGCEALVEKDAPQTTQELYQHIVDCNPATFKPHKPTGEELAEMAEEGAHG